MESEVGPRRRHSINRTPTKNTDENKDIRKRDRSPSSIEKKRDAKKHKTQETKTRRTNWRDTERRKSTDYQDMVDRFNACCDEVIEATTRYQSGKVQFNKQEQQTVGENIHDMREMFTLLAFDLGRMVERRSRDDIMEELRQIRADIDTMRNQGQNTQQRKEQRRTTQTRGHQEHRETEIKDRRQTQGEASGNNTGMDTDVVESVTETEHEEEWTQIERRQKKPKRRKTYAQVAERKRMNTTARTVENKEKKEWNTPEKRDRYVTVVGIAEEGNAQNTLQRVKDLLTQGKYDEGFGAVTKRNDGKLVLVTTNNDQKNKVEELLRKDDALEIHTERKFKPRLLLTGLQAGMSEDRLKQTVIEENEVIKTMYTEEWKAAKILTKKTCRNKEKENVLMEMEPNLFKYLVKKGSVNCELVVCHVEEVIDLPVCFKCCVFGHVSKYCKKEDVCHKCGGKHKGKDCEYEGKLDCPNCERRGLVPRQHTARDKNCPVYKKKMEERKAYICYGSIDG